MLNITGKLHIVTLAIGLLGSSPAVATKPFAVRSVALVDLQVESLLAGQAISRRSYHSSNSMIDVSRDGRNSVVVVNALAIERTENQIVATQVLPEHFKLVMADESDRYKVTLVSKQASSSDTNPESFSPTLYCSSDRTDLQGEISDELVGGWSYVREFVRAGDLIQTLALEFELLCDAPLVSKVTGVIGFNRATPTMALPPLSSSKEPSTAIASEIASSTPELLTALNTASELSTVQHFWVTAGEQVTVRFERKPTAMHGELREAAVQGQQVQAGNHWPKGARLVANSDGSQSVHWVPSNTDSGSNLITLNTLPASGDMGHLASTIHVEVLPISAEAEVSLDQVASETVLVLANGHGQPIWNGDSATVNENLISINPVANATFRYEKQGGAIEQASMSQLVVGFDKLGKRLYPASDLAEVQLLNELQLLDQLPLFSNLD